MRGNANNIRESSTHDITLGDYSRHYSVGNKTRSFTNSISSWRRAYEDTVLTVTQLISLAGAVCDAVRTNCRFDCDALGAPVWCWGKGAITSKIKHAIKQSKSCMICTTVAQLLQPSLPFCFSLQPMTAYRPAVVQVLQDLFYVLLHVLFYLWSLL